MIARVLRCALCIGAAAAFFAGCGGSQPHVAPDFMPQNSAITSAAHGKSWMQPGVKGRDLLYAAVGSGITVYTYPRGHLVGSLGVGGTYLCNDTAGNVFIPAGAFGTQILVYAHGATKAKATLNDPYPAVACSVDPTTERVAVTAGFGGGIVIYPYKPKQGWRYAKVYRDPDLQSIIFCAYDKNGNLFVDGKDSAGDFVVAEMPKGSQTFNAITLDQPIKTGGSIQFDGKYLAIADYGAGYPTAAVVYRFALSGSSGTRISKTTLDDSLAFGQFWIQGGKIIGPIGYDSISRYRVLAVSRRWLSQQELCWPRHLPQRGSRES